MMVPSVMTSLALLCLAVAHLLPLIHAQTNRYRYSPTELGVLQTLQAAWVSSTADEHNLAGWSATQPLPCYQNTSAEQHNWKGVQCLQLCANLTVCDVHIIGLKITDAEISGSLPPEIGNLSELTTLTLSGNPNLSGSLPKQLEKTQLDYLDLHDNGFTGTVPVFDGLWTLLYLDLSGNRLSGGFPLTELRRMVSLQTLSLAANSFEGTMPSDALHNMTQLETLNLSRNSFIGPLPNVTRGHHLQNLDFSGNNFTGPLPDYTMLDDIRHVNLSNNQLTGEIHLASIFNSTIAPYMAVLDLSKNQITGLLPLWNSIDLGALEYLYLDNNSITGTLNITYLSAMGFLVQKNASLNSNKRLKHLSLVHNKITNVVYEEWNIENTLTVFMLQGNPFCEGDFNSGDDAKRCYCLQICFSTADTSRNTRKILIISVTSTAGSLLLILILIVAFILHRSRRYKRYLLLQVQQKFSEFDVKPTIFSYSELRVATRDFHPDNKLGEGSYGAVFKGVLASGNVVAVKQLFMKTAQGIDDFLNEIVLISGMKHRNLVSLKGCCLRENQRLLVYEFVENNDLEVLLLNGGQFKALLNWPVRRNICLGVAHGLHYLHALAQPRIIHRDIKASNILLDKNFEPKIADFGLALLFPDEQSHIMTIHIAGTKGYLAPEYASMGQLSEKVDVFSFGVLCLEVISGRKNICHDAPLDEVYLTAWAWALHDAGKVMDIVDRTLVLQEDELLDVQRLINIALLCLQNVTEQRPTMSRVVAMLQGDTESEVVVLSNLASERSMERLRLLNAVEMRSLSPVSEERPLSFKGKDIPSSSSTQRSEHTATALLQLPQLRGR